MKSSLIHGLIAGILAGLAGVIYLYIYQSLYLVDYSLVINVGSIIGSSIFGTLLMAMGQFALSRMVKRPLKGVLNLLYMVLSFASIIPVMLMSLPLEVEFPELFPGLAIPMHFFPALAYFGVDPFFPRSASTPA